MGSTIETNTVMQEKRLFPLLIRIFIMALRKGEFPASGERVVRRKIVRIAAVMLLIACAYIFLLVISAIVVVTFPSSREIVVFSEGIGLWGAGISLGLIILIVLTLIKTGISSEPAESVWAEAAKRLGLQYEGSLSHRISGILRGQRVSVRTLSQRFQDHESPYTFYHVSYPEPLGLGLQLTQRRSSGETVKQFCLKCIEIGDAKFDTYVETKGDNAKRIAEFLTYARRTETINMLKSLDNCVIDDEGISWKKSGAESNATDLVNTVKLMVDMACLLTTDL